MVDLRELPPWQPLTPPEPSWRAPSGDAANGADDGARMWPAKLKIYAIKQHELCSHLVALATNIGVFVLSLDGSAPRTTAVLPSRTRITPDALVCYDAGADFAGVGSSPARLLVSACDAFSLSAFTSRDGGSGDYPTAVSPSKAAAAALSEAFGRDDLTAGAAASQDLREDQRGYANAHRFPSRLNGNDLKEACIIESPPSPTLPQLLPSISGCVDGTRVSCESELTLRTHATGERWGLSGHRAQ